MTGITLANDCTTQFVQDLPPGLAVGYTTGQGIAWTPAQWAAHPNAVRICQDSGSDVTADILDVESGAATLADAAAWVPKAQAAYKAVRRPGQRWPGLYISISGLTPLLNELESLDAGYTYVPMFLAHWDNAEAADAAAILARSGPYPVIGFQYENVGTYDQDVFSSDWLSQVSHAAPVTPPKRYPVTKLPPGEWLPGMRISDGTWHTESANGAEWSPTSPGG